MNFAINDGLRGYLQNLNGNKLLERSKFQDVFDIILHVADIFPILLQFSAELIQYSFLSNSAFVTKKYQIIGQQTKTLIFTKNTDMVALEKFDKSTMLDFLCISRKIEQLFNAAENFVGTFL